MLLCQLYGYSQYEEDSSSESLRPSCQCSRPSATLQRYNRKWEKDFQRLEFEENCRGAFCKVCRKSESLSQTSQGSSDVYGSQSLNQTSQGSSGLWGTEPEPNLARK